MSLERKEIEHRMLRARQRTGSPPDQGSDPASAIEPSALSPSSSSVSSATTTPSTTTAQTTSTSEQSTTTTSSVSSASSSTPSTTSSTTTSSSSSSSSSSISTSSSSTATTTTTSSSSTTTSSTTSTTSSVPSSTSTSTFFVTAGPETSSFSSISRIATSASVAGGSTVSASDTATTQSGAINTGALVGGIAGGLFALAVLGFIVACVLRRKNRRRREERFNAAQFRKSAMVMNDEGFTPIPRPLEMIQNRMNVVPSTGSIVGAGMAGAGAYKYQNQDAQGFDEPYHDNTPMTAEHGYSAQPVGEAAYHQPLQPRQQYTFGQAYEPSVGDAYGSEHHGSDYHGADMYDPAMFTNYPKQQVTQSPAPNRHSVATVADDAYGGI